MIFVTLGTQDKSFVRLLKAIDEAIKAGYIKEKVIVQAGFTEYESPRMQIFKLMPMVEFTKLIQQCDLLITHAGVGSIMSGLKNNKKVLAVARLKKYGEHTNDHQIQIGEAFAQKGYIKYTASVDNFAEIYQELKKFKPQKFVSNNAHFCQIITDFIK